MATSKTRRVSKAPASPRKTSSPRNALARRTPKTRPLIFLMSNPSLEEWNFISWVGEFDEKTLSGHVLVNLSNGPQKQRPPRIGDRLLGRISGLKAQFEFVEVKPVEHFASHFVGSVRYMVPNSQTPPDDEELAAPKTQRKIA